MPGPGPEIRLGWVEARAEVERQRALHAGGRGEPGSRVAAAVRRIRRAARRGRGCRRGWMRHEGSFPGSRSRSPGLDQVGIGSDAGAVGGVEGVPALGDLGVAGRGAEVASGDRPRESRRGDHDGVRSSGRPGDRARVTAGRGRRRGREWGVWWRAGAWWVCGDKAGGGGRLRARRRRRRPAPTGVRRRGPRRAGGRTAPARPSAPCVSHTRSHSRARRTRPAPSKVGASGVAATPPSVEAARHGPAAPTGDQRGQARGPGDTDRPGAAKATASVPERHRRTFRLRMFASVKASQPHLARV